MRAEVMTQFLECRRQLLPDRSRPSSRRVVMHRRRIGDRCGIRPRSRSVTSRREAVERRRRELLLTRGGLRLSLSLGLRLRLSLSLSLRLRVRLGLNVGCVRVRRDLGCPLRRLLRLHVVALLLIELLRVRLRVVSLSRPSSVRCRRQTAVRSLRVSWGCRGRRRLLRIAVTRRRNKGCSERFSENEGVHPSLSGGPSLLGVEMKKTLHEIDERDSIPHFYVVVRQGKVRNCCDGDRASENGDEPLSISASFNPFRTIGYCLMISGNVVAEKYFLLGCSFALNSCEYRSSDLSRYRRRPYSSAYVSKKCDVCLPLSSMWSGGMPSISTMRVIWLNSLVPGKSGSPRNSSTQMQPSDHMSIMAEYGRLRMTSGER